VMACLPTLSGLEDCDELAVNFCYVNSKNARKRMVGPLLQPQLRTLAALQTACLRRGLSTLLQLRNVCPVWGMVKRRGYISCSNGATRESILLGIRTKCVISGVCHRRGRCLRHRRARRTCWASTVAWRPRWRRSSLTWRPLCCAPWRRSLPSCR
jgi:hypothetical protein